MSTPSPETPGPPELPGAPVPGAPPPTPPSRGLAGSAALAAGLIALVYVVLNLMAGPVVRRIEDGLVRGDPTAADSPLILTYDYLALPTTGITVVAWVLTCVWLTRMRDYGQAVSPKIGHHRHVAWVWLGWFVPVVALWFPYQVVRDLDRSILRQVHVPALLGWWWVAWLVMVVSNRVHDGLVAEMFETGELDVGQAQVTGLVAAATTLVALALWLALVRRITVGAQGHVGAARLRT